MNQVRAGSILDRLFIVQPLVEVGIDGNGDRHAEESTVDCDSLADVTSPLSLADRIVDASVHKQLDIPTRIKEVVAAHNAQSESKEARQGHAVFIPSRVRFFVCCATIKHCVQSRPSTTTTAQLFDDQPVKPLIFFVLEPQDIESYAAKFPVDKFEHVNFIRLPENDRGLAFARSVITVVADALKLKR